MRRASALVAAARAGSAGDRLRRRLAPVLQLVPRVLDRSEPADQVGLDLLELLDVQQARAARGQRLARGGHEPGVLCFDLHEHPLQGGDLGAQLAPVRRRLVGLRRGSRIHVQRRRDLARVDARLVGLAGGVRRDRARGGGPVRGVGDVRAAALLALDHALVLQALVDGAHSVGVDLQRLGQVPQTRKALPGREAAVVDARAQSPRHLHPDRDLCAAVDREVQAAQTPGVRLASHALTLATSGPTRQSASELVHWRNGTVARLG